jgi:hypothetical protein
MSKNLAATINRLRLEHVLIEWLRERKAINNGLEHVLVEWLRERKAINNVRPEM